ARIRSCRTGTLHAEQVQSSHTSKEVPGQHDAYERLSLAQHRVPRQFKDGSAMIAGSRARAASLPPEAAIDVLVIYSSHYWACPGHELVSGRALSRPAKRSTTMTADDIAQAVVLTGFRWGALAGTLAEERLLTYWNEIKSLIQ